jgi:hypothetical protein
MSGLSNGTRVQISGLQGAAELNGKEGTVVSEQDPESGRVTIAIDGVGEKKLKPQNLSKIVKGGVFFPAGTRVKVSGLTGAAHLNDKEGNIIRKDDATGRYTVDIDGEGEKNLKPENLSKASSVKTSKPDNMPSNLPPELLEEGFQIAQHVRVGGLNGAKELNGQIGVIFGYDKETQRYILEFEASGQKKIKKENMVPMNVCSGFLSAKARMMNGIS